MDGERDDGKGAATRQERKQNSVEDGGQPSNSLRTKTRGKATFFTVTEKACLAGQMSSSGGMTCPSEFWEAVNPV